MSRRGRRPPCGNKCGHLSDGIVLNGRNLCFPCYDGRQRRRSCTFCLQQIPQKVPPPASQFCSADCLDEYRDEETMILSGATLPDTGALV